jgi:hypothetical protein
MIDLQPFLPNLATVRRRTGGASGKGASTDALNAQVYGDPINWTVVYTDMPCRFEERKKDIQFTPAGERLPSDNILYVSSEYIIETEDRITIGNNTYIAQGIMTAYDPVGGVHHYEIHLLIEP